MRRYPRREVCSGTTSSHEGAHAARLARQYDLDRVVHAGQMGRSSTARSAGGADGARARPLSGDDLFEGLHYRLGQSFGPVALDDLAYLPVRPLLQRRRAVVGPA